MFTDILNRINAADNPANTKYLKTFVQRRPNVFDVGPTLYKCYTNVLCLLGNRVICNSTKFVDKHVDELAISNLFIM